MIYEEIKALCEKNGISIARLEKECHIGNGIIARWKKADPSFSNICKIADYFNVPLDSFRRKSS